MSEPTTQARPLDEILDIPLDRVAEVAARIADIDAEARAAALAEREALRAEYQRFYDFVADADPALVDAWHFGENNKPGGLAERVRAALAETPEAEL